MPGRVGVLVLSGRIAVTVPSRSVPVLLLQACSLLSNYPCLPLVATIRVSLQTSNPDVYAIGDVAAFPLQLTGGTIVRQEHVTCCRSVIPVRLWRMAACCS